MLLSSFMKVCSATKIRFSVWTQSEYDDDCGTCLDSFMLDYGAPLGSEEWERGFWRYEALKAVRARVRHVSTWTANSLHILVIIDNEFDYKREIRKHDPSYIQSTVK